MPMTGTVDAANARVDLFVDYAAEPGTQTFATVFRRVGSLSAPDEYVRGLFGSTLLGEQAYVSDHEAPLDAQLWYVAVSDTGTTLVAGPFTIPSQGFVWLKDPGRPWADLKLDLCESPSRSEAECPDEPIVSDTFTRTVTDGWGTADSGQAWTNSGGAAADFDVATGSGTHTHPAVNTIHRSVITATTADQDIVATVAVDRLASGDSFFTGPVARHTDASNYYWSRGTFTPTGTVQLAIRRRLAGVETGIGSVITLPFGYVAGQRFRIRLRVVGQDIYARMWPESVAETEDWTVRVTDSALTLAGSVGVRSLVGSASTAALGTVFSFDDFQYADASAVSSTDIAWVGFKNKIRQADAGLFPILDAERPADVFARRKDISTSIMFLSRSLGALTGIYDLFTAGGPLLVQVPAEYGMDAPYGQRDRYYQPDDLTEAYLSQDQRKTYRLWSADATAVDAPIGEPQGTDTANWCALADTYATMGAYAASGFTWAQAANGQASTTNLPGLYGSGPYGSGPYGG